ncbi:MAG: hypothetical protein H6874_08305 [Hyphomicrobiaceae bacterium]|nr:hypothetical protein [Hyphomicrobiaceae bacterium]
MLSTIAGSEFLVNVSASYVQTESTIAQLTNGNYVVVYSSVNGDLSGYGIKARIFDQDGNEVVPEFTVNQNTSLSQTSPSVAAYSDGRFVVAWTTDDSTADTDGRAIKARIVNADGTMTNSEFLVNASSTADQRSSDVVQLSNGNVVYAWETLDAAQDTEGAAIKARIFSEAGVGVVNEFLVNEVGTGSQLQVGLAAWADGKFVAVYYSGDRSGGGFQVKFRIFENNGTESVTETIVGVSATFSNLAPDVTTLADGGFAITLINSLLPSHAYINLYNQDGSVRAEGIQVNSDTLAAGNTPQVFGMEDGRILVTYSVDNSSGGTGDDVYAIILNSDGTVSVDEFQVAELTAENQRYVAVIGNDVGELFFTWNTNDETADTSGGGIKGRMFDVGRYTEGTSLGETLDGNAARDEIDGKGGDDTISGGVGDDILRGGSGIDTLEGGSGADTLSGDAGVDTLKGGTGSDTLDGGSDGDTLLGGEGADFLNGGGGDDVLKGNQGVDELDGGGDNDQLFGGENNDILTGGSGEDILKGQTGADNLDGGGDNDQLFGAEGADILDGGSGNDLLKGERGNDELDGGTDDDELIGGDGADILDGNRGNDILKGDAGADILIGSAGDDEMTGGGGGDTFVFAPDDGNDTITDFTNGSDLFDLSAFGFVSKTVAKAKFFEIGSATDDTFGFDFDGTVITINGMDLGDLNNADIII